MSIFTAQKIKELVASNAELKSIGKKKLYKKGHDTIYQKGERFFHECFDYDFTDGNLYWSIFRPAHHFYSEKYMKVYMDNRAGMIVGGSIDSNGYKGVQFKDKKTLKLHRIIFFMAYGWLPEEVDHINGIRTDNRLENLRPCTKALNCKNRGVNKNNSSGFKGVDLINRTGMYRAQIQNNKRKVVLGTFKTAKEASEAYIDASKSLHMEFSRVT